MSLKSLMFLKALSRQELQHCQLLAGVFLFSYQIADLQSGRRFTHKKFWLTLRVKINGFIISFSFSLY